MGNAWILVLFFPTRMDATNLYNAFKKTQDQDSLTKYLYKGKLTFMIEFTLGSNLDDTTDRT